MCKSLSTLIVVNWIEQIDRTYSIDGERVMQALLNLLILYIRSVPRGTIIEISIAIDSDDFHNKCDEITIIIQSQLLPS